MDNYGEVLWIKDYNSLGFASFEGQFSMQADKSNTFTFFCSSQDNFNR